MVFRIFKIIATSDSVVTALECTKFVFGRGSARNFAWELTAFPYTPIAGLRGLTSKAEGRGRRGEREKRREREGPAPLSQIPGFATGLGMI